jgi:hypothetical protein
MAQPTLTQQSCQEAGTSAEPTLDCLSSLPPSVLATIHGHVFVDSAWGLRHALALEAASKHLSTLLRAYTRFPEVRASALPSGTAVQKAGGAASFWKWIAAHGHRVDHLAFFVPPDRPGDEPAARLPLFREQEGLRSAQEGVRAVSLAGTGFFSTSRLTAVPTVCSCSCLAATPTVQSAHCQSADCPV